MDMLRRVTTKEDAMEAGMKTRSMLSTGVTYRLCLKKIGETISNNKMTSVKKKMKH